MAYRPAPSRPGVELMRLFADGREEVRLERWASGAAIALEAPGSAEVLVLEGGFDDGGDRFEPQSWLRLPPGAALRVPAGAAGRLLHLVKIGRLVHIEGLERS